MSGGLQLLNLTVLVASGDQYGTRSIRIWTGEAPPCGGSNLACLVIQVQVIAQYICHGMYSN